MKNGFLEGELIHLRPLKKDDKNSLFLCFHDYNIRSKIGKPYPLTEEDIDDLISRKSKEDIWFVIERNTDNVLIGFVGLLSINSAFSTAHVNILIVQADHQGKGYGSDALNLLLDYAFGTLHCNRIGAVVPDFNVLAIDFFKSNVFKEEGIIEQGYYWNYQYHDFILLRILKSEFSGHKENR